VTLDDVARAAGVSSATVSRALGNDSRISARTREVVAQAAARLGYVPNVAARSLVVRATRTLGLLIPDATDPVHGQVVGGFEQAAAARGYTAIVANGFDDEAREWRALQVFSAHRADGIVLMGSVLDQRRVLASAQARRVVFISGEHLDLAGYTSDLPVGCIRADDAGGVEALVGHLLEVGCRRIGYLNGPHAASNATRREAAARALRAAGVDGRLRKYQGGGEAWRLGVPSAARIARDGLDALVCFDDKLALGAMDALRARGLRVPDDIAVAGFDDIPFAAVSNPRLTTVAQPSAEMGRLAVEMILQAIETDELPPSILLPTRLVVRESTVRRDRNPLAEGS
jgi:DNA-binding LacI/PurR family transcriptional regulator